MTMPETGKAFAVLFENLHRWSVSSFFIINWKWPSHLIKPLAFALKRKSISLDWTKAPLDRTVLISLSFNGEIEIRNTNIDNFKGRLFLAGAGDVIYSKIDVRNGAIGIVPDTLPSVAVSSEFPVYHVQPDIALPRYIELVVRTEGFRRQINSLISGTSGSKRVYPADLEEIKIPLPDQMFKASLWISGRKQRKLSGLHETISPYPSQR